MNRRMFIGGMSAFGTVLLNGNLSFTAENAGGDKAVIYLFLSGGASHIETFNPIPTAAGDRRSVTGAINTNVVGMQIGGLFKELSNIADKFSIVRSFRHRDANHASATHWLMTGEPNFGNGETQKWPSYGSVVSGKFGPNVDSGLPTYIKLNEIQHDDAAWMGGRYVGYDANDEGRRDLMLGIPQDRFQARLAMLERIDRDFHRGNMLSDQWKDLREQATSVMIGQASEAFKVENDALYDSFKNTRLGKDLLTSIRLVEAGSKFITVNYGGWDMHNDIGAALNNRQVELDTYLSLFVKTLEERGLSDRVMFVVTSEFGRTPKVNAQNGRDHWARLVPLMISCGAYEMGRVIGTSDRNAEEADESPFEPEDLKWTMFNFLGIEKSMKWTAIDARPMTIIKEEAKLIL